MLQHPLNLFEKISQDDMDALVNGALEILNTAGYDVFSPTALAVLKRAGVRLEGERAFPQPEFILEQLAKAPESWTWLARNPEKDVEIGKGAMALTPAYGSSFIADAKGVRRNALMDDYIKLTQLTQAIEDIDGCSFIVVEPQDVPVEERALRMTRAMLDYSDKPIMGAVMTPEEAEASISLARLAMGGREGAFILGNINGNSPLSLEKNMGESMMTYVRHGQPIYFTPSANMGIVGPVTPEGTCAFLLVEIMMALTIIQCENPGHPVIMGTGSFGTDLRNASTGYGRAEHVLGTLVMAQAAQHLKIPYRCTASVTGSCYTDARSGYEAMETAMAGWMAGASLAVHCFGILDNISSVSYEKFMMDLEIWRNLKSFGRPMEFNRENLAIDLALERPAMFLAHPHTMKHFREVIYQPLYAVAKPYDPENIPDVTAMAADLCDMTLAAYEKPAMAPEVAAALDAHMESKGVTP
ncbi:MAG: trimethylamine methyltransferase family protein [Desulfobacterales bacterium]|nr:trimethylamine methyltransferase family protein [Desulfobacterales bacterium]